MNAKQFNQFSKKHRERLFEFILSVSVDPHFLFLSFEIITYLTEASSLISFSAFYLSFSLSPMICTYMKASKVLIITVLNFLTWTF